MSDSLGHRRKLCFWGWGYEDEALTAAEVERLREMAKMLGVSGHTIAEPQLAEFDLPAPRVANPCR